MWDLERYGTSWHFAPVDAHPRRHRFMSIGADEVQPAQVTNFGTFIRAGQSEFALFYKG
jgi:hypothetical protein